MIRGQNTERELRNTKMMGQGYWERSEADNFHHPRTRKVGVMSWLGGNRDHVSLKGQLILVLSQALPCRNVGPGLPDLPIFKENLEIWICV